MPPVVAVVVDIFKPLFLAQHFFKALALLIDQFRGKIPVAKYAVLWLYVVRTTIPRMNDHMRIPDATASPDT